MSYAWSARPLAVTEMTSTADGRTHLIAANDFDAGLWRGNGVYRAICGTDVLAAAMASGPGPGCSACRQAAESAPGTALALGATARRQPTRWPARSLGFLRSPRIGR